MATIEETTKRGLCVSCGSCKAVCPTEAITYSFQYGIFVPSINKEKCINCSKCFHNHPSWRLEENVFLNLLLYEG